MVERKKTVTSKDVAKLAGVSQSTVSRVFIDGGLVSEKARIKVLEAAKNLNYRPNAFARSLTTSESRLVGLVFPDVDYPIHMETLQLLSTQLQRNGYAAVLIPWELDEQQQHSIPNIFQYKVDGVIAASAQFNTALYEECRDFNIPIVQFARVEQGTQCSSAISDHYSAGQQAAKMLIKHGAQNPAYLAGDIPSRTNAERQEGFVEGVQQLTAKEPSVFQVSFDYQQALTDLRLLLQGSSRPDAVFCATDLLAIALMDVARYEFDLRVPEDLQVIGFDDVPQASWLSYRLTTFKQDFSRLAKEAVRLLHEKMHDDQQELIKLMIPTELMIRDTLKRID